METTLVVGDIHFKGEIILPRIDQILSRFGIERIVFLGDYCDEWLENADSAPSKMIYFTNWLIEKRYSIEIDLLLGNHDMQYIIGVPGSGTCISYMQEIKEIVLSWNPKIATTVDRFLLTHAGITNTWAEDFLDCEFKAKPISNALNEMYDRKTSEDLFALLSAGKGRRGTSVPGPLWADIKELIEDLPTGLDQIVGHSPIHSCISTYGFLRTFLTEPSTSEVWACDTFSLYPWMEPIGDGSMLLVNNSEVSVVNVKEESWISASSRFLASH